MGSYSQTLAQEMAKQDLKDKSRRQTRTGVILIVGGAGLVLGGAELMFEEKTTDLGAAMFVIGGLVTLSGIPVLINSFFTRSKAKRMSFRNEPTHIPKYAGNLPRSVPSITYSIPLN
jgi:uncharacterized membrane protein HdeD (DUF308 family)